MPNTVTSNGAANAIPAEPAPTIADAVVSSPKDPTITFWELAELCYELFKVLGAVTQYLNDELQKSVLNLRDLNTAQLLANQSGPPADPPLKPGDGFAFGGGTADPNSDPDGSNAAGLKRANDLLAILHRYGLATDIPADYLKNNGAVLTEASRRNITVQAFTNLQSNLTNSVERIKNSSGVQTTKAEGALKSSNAAVELSTGVTKGLISMEQVVAGALKM